MRAAVYSHKVVTVIIWEVLVNSVIVLHHSLVGQAGIFAHHQPACANSHNRADDLSAVFSLASVHNPRIYPPTLREFMRGITLSPVSQVAFLTCSQLSIKKIASECGRAVL